MKAARWRYALALFVVTVAAVAALSMAWRQPAPGIAAARRAPHTPPMAQHARDVEGWEAASLARPLFSRRRRPPPDAGPASAAAEPPPVPPRLTGVLVGPFGGSAVFAPAGSSESVTVQEGGQVGIYRVRRITPDEVLVDGPDGERVLRPTFGPVPGRQPAPDPRAVLGSPSHLASRR